LERDLFTGFHGIVQLLLLQLGCPAGPRRAGKRRTHGHPQPTTMWDHHPGTQQGDGKSQQLAGFDKTVTKIRWKKERVLRGVILHQPERTARKKKGNRNRETVPGPGGWMPTQKPRK